MRHSRGFDPQEFRDAGHKEKRHLANVQKILETEPKILKNVLGNLYISKKLLVVLSTKPQQERIDILDKFALNATVHTSPYMKRHTERYALDPEIDLKNFLKELSLLKKIIVANSNFTTSKALLGKYTRAQLLEKGFWFFPKAPMGYHKEGQTLILDQEIVPSIKEGLEKFAEGKILTPRWFGMFLAQKLNGGLGNERENNKYVKMARKIFNDPSRLWVYAGYVYFDQYGIDFPMIGKHPAIIDLATLVQIFERIEAQRKEEQEKKNWGKKDQRVDDQKIENQPTYEKNLAMARKLLEENPSQLLEEIQPEVIEAPVQEEIIEAPKYPQTNQGYIAVMKDAARLFSEKNYSEAKLLYQEALDLFIKLFPSKGIEKIKVTLHPYTQIKIIDDMAKNNLVKEDKKAQKALEAAIKKSMKEIKQEEKEGKPLSGGDDDANLKRFI